MWPRIIYLSGGEAIRKGSKASTNLLHLVPDVPIVAITAFDVYGMREAALEAGLQRLPQSRLISARWMKPCAGYCRDGEASTVYSGPA